MAAMVATARIRRQGPTPPSVLGMLVFIAAETMFFAGLISAFTISRAGARPGVWHVPSEPLLPAASTLINTTALLASAVCILIAGRHFRQRSPATKRLLAAAWILGAGFVLLQGREWVGLLSGGLTMLSSPLGAFFYLIVGIHGLHALGALAGLGVAWLRMRQGTLTPGFFFGAQIFWLFVVGIWPIIYLRVYF
jgi:heme/copper-type cytochrome/quinol oxidase subunit 3